MTDFDGHKHTALDLFVFKPCESRARAEGGQNGAQAQRIAQTSRDLSRDLCRLLLTLPPMALRLFAYDVARSVAHLTNNVRVQGALAVMHRYLLGEATQADLAAAEGVIDLEREATSLRSFAADTAFDVVSCVIAAVRAEKSRDAVIGIGYAVSFAACMAAASDYRVARTQGNTGVYVPNAVVTRHIALALAYRAGYKGCQGCKECGVTSNVNPTR